MPWSARSHSHAETAWNSPICPRRSAYIIAVLELNGGNQTRAAEQLGIGSATLYRKLKSYGLTRARRAEK
jgi:DNA-binding NtrC family response regulator